MPENLGVVGIDVFLSAETKFVRKGNKKGRAAGTAAQHRNMRVQAPISGIVFLGKNIVVRYLLATATE